MKSRNPVMGHSRLVPPKCVEDGQPPCPLCPVRAQCGWAAKVMAPDDGEHKVQTQKGKR